jgi:RNA polymerase sigma-70 factor (ECF subfamily)
MSVLNSAFLVRSGFPSHRLQLITRDDLGTYPQLRTSEPHPEPSTQRPEPVESTSRPEHFPTAAGGVKSTNCVTDEELVARAAGDDHEAFAELVRRYQAAVYRAARIASGSDAEADEAAQEAFVTAYRRLSTFRAEASFKTWLVAIAWRKGLDRRKGMRRWLTAVRIDSAAAEHDHNAIADLPADATGPVADQEDAVLSRELRTQMKKVIGALPARLRQPLLLAAAGDFSYEEIARIVGAPVGTIKYRVSEARRQVKAKLARLGYLDV